MNLVGTKDGLFVVARACEDADCEAVHVATATYTERTLPRALRARLDGDAVRFLVRETTRDAARADGWFCHTHDPYAPAEDDAWWCAAHRDRARAPTEWPSVDHLLAHLPYGGRWRVTTPTGSYVCETRIHNRVPEIRREGRTAWDVYGLYTPRRNVTITPEYVTPAETAAPRDAYEPNQGARDL